MASKSEFRKWRKENWESLKWKSVILNWVGVIIFFPVVLVLMLLKLTTTFGLYYLDQIDYFLDNKLIHFWSFGNFYVWRKFKKEHKNKEKNDNV